MLRMRHSYNNFININWAKFKHNLFLYFIRNLFEISNHCLTIQQ